MNLLSYDQYQKGLAILSAHGLPPVDKYKMGVWWRSLKVLMPNIFEAAVRDLCRNRPSFYPTDNIPGLIFESIKKNQDDAVVKRLRLKRAFAVDERDYHPMTEAEQSQVKAMIKNIWSKKSAAQTQTQI